MSSNVSIPSFGADYGTAKTLFCFDKKGLYPRKDGVDMAACEAALNRAPEFKQMKTASSRNQNDTPNLLDLCPPLRSYALVRKENNEIIALGDAAYNRIGRTPKHLKVVRCVDSGRMMDTDIMISLFDAVLPQLLTDHDWKKGPPKLNKPKLVILPVSGNTERVHAQIMRRAIQSRFMPPGQETAFSNLDFSSGEYDLNAEYSEINSYGVPKYRVVTVTQAGVALLGAGIDLMDGKARLFVDIGGGTMNVAIICNGHVIFHRSFPLGGDLANKIIVKYFFTKKNILIGLLDAEKIKIELATAIRPGHKGHPKKRGEVEGKHAETGMPAKVDIDSEELFDCLNADYYQLIIGAITLSLHEFGEPQIISDIQTNDGLLGGGGSQVDLIDELIRRALNLSIWSVPDPQYSVIKGTKFLLEHPDWIDEFDLDLLSRSQFQEEEPWRPMTSTAKTTKTGVDSVPSTTSPNSTPSEPPQLPSPMTSPPMSAPSMVMAAGTNGSLTLES
ncbi:MAG: hypothetical protein A3I07_02460 [Candidatus Doudnabacteria bacterium RIFCSPLOWO2_02_FULL_42_9]|uniref:Uncharacterized protein n=1 Tax=Candidatus Doudnabacteria bacterium RIFCSPHIGHO2_01_FULL_41_86 TaxID=1817821 RepID=A0A1F5N8T4_9BACT|nr:MAG: hypothetical protein A2717_00965 [Candidatus Doudnabacteria bacterium RIFCSPHIGHO2_01_FULL_41_86]OGE85150.1 MAG: hypothetical protein A3E28_00540 [Candidatus Doudnabacteria bacterium RIFCSPHIGHO2_12_FULL_42_22]OGE86689.1 MAG: hypothetical protein A3C49_01375 [Candidatus Doudnabacteria bacterium RIFCSPHIGHO2_02_FULL_42_25]OGE92286.1 MAG: hypothetical protein A2895_01530 [Candidatus Doudnabacteria bacterium RIFCSPLOWO2_01_FULL_42_60]OGE99589.1 MAG: hypothetical protein A3I07_02460 [Candid